MTSSPTDIFRSISPAEFFYRNRQMAGFSNPTQSLYTTVRELVENSLDSCEEAGLLPKIEVTISSIQTNTFQVTVSDNGTGVPPENVPDAFAKVLYGSKYSSRQRRGTFGMGVTMSVLYGQVSTDNPAIIHTRTMNDGGTRFSLFIDVEKNIPIIDSVVPLSRNEQGTTVSITLHGDLKRSKERVIEYLRLTCLSTPYSQISLQFDESESICFGGFTDELPPIPNISKPHPRVADLEMLRRMIKTQRNMQIHDFLVSSFQQVGTATATKFLRFVNMNPKTEITSLSRNELIYLSSSLRKYDGFGRPDSDCLSPIGKVAFMKAVRCEYDTSIASYSQRGPMEWDGFPYIVEGTLVVSNSFDKSEVPSLFRFANRVPLLYDSGDDVFAKTLRKIPWSRYGIHDSSRVGIFMHFCSTRVPYSAAGKQSISSVGSIESDILSIYRDLGRTLKRFSDRKRKGSQYERKYREFSKSFKLLAKFSSEVAGDVAAPDTDDMVNALFEVNVDV